MARHVHVFESRYSQYGLHMFQDIEIQEGILSFIGRHESPGNVFS